MVQKFQAQGKEAAVQRRHKAKYAYEQPQNLNSTLWDSTSMTS